MSNPQGFRRLTPHFPSIEILPKSLVRYLFSISLTTVCQSSRRCIILDSLTLKGLVTGPEFSSVANLGRISNNRVIQYLLKAE